MNRDMKKQTNMSGSKFGGDWTRQKLLVIEEYLKSYATVLKKTKTQRIYVDAFAGSGKTEIKEKTAKIEVPQLDLFETVNGFENFKPSKSISPPSILDGSAVLSLKYDFDRYYFIDLDEERLIELETRIKIECPYKINQIHFIKGDSNEVLKNLMSNISVYDRCLMFLDPYALELEWSTLEIISKKCVIDLWYLFPLNALTRVIPRDGSKLNRCKKIISTILGTEEWETSFYETTGQSDMWGEEKTERIEFDRLVTFVMDRFKKLFPYVFGEPIILRNEKQSPLFLLSFMMTNTSPAAINLASKLSKGIKAKLEKLYGSN
jgi:three-Cys-motif partner protein